MKNKSAFVIACVVLLGADIFLYQNILFPKDTTCTSSKLFPNRIRNWIGKDLTYDEEVLGELYADRIVYKRYTNRGGPSVILFVAYYSSMEGADHSHSPIVCFSGQGWKMEETDKAKIRTRSSENSRIEVNRIIIEKPNLRMIALFWYQSTDQAFRNRGSHKVSLFLDALSGKPTVNAFVRVTVTVSQGMSDQDGVRYLNAFVQDMYPDLEAFLS